MSIATLAALAALLLAPFAAAPSAAAAPDKSTVVIDNSGSTNSPGLHVVIDRTGKAVYTETRRRAPAEGAPTTKQLPADVTAKLFSDLEASGPLSQLPAVHCAKSVSFGVTITIGFAGEKTPDLDCAGSDAKLKLLQDDAAQVTSLLRK